jgi:integrase
MSHHPISRPQYSARKNLSSHDASIITADHVIPLGGEIATRGGDSLRWWVEQYFRYQVTTSEASQKAQRRDLSRFLAFIEHEEGRDDRLAWTPRLSRAFRDHLRTELNADGSRRWSDRTINRMVATLKTFSKWVHKLTPFSLGDPMENLKNLRAAQRLEVDRALTKGERRRLLDTADALQVIGGRSTDRNRYSTKSPAERPQHKSYRPLRNRAIIYSLIETGMRRAAVVGLEVDDVDFGQGQGQVTAVEKGGDEHTYQISTQGLGAIRDYLEQERPQDADKWACPTLFLSPHQNPHGTGRLNVRVINTVWAQVCQLAGVEGKSPHAARHAMGKHIIEKTGNVAAVQAQLGHRNPATSMQYARLRSSELRAILNDRDSLSYLGGDMIS